MTRWRETLITPEHSLLETIKNIDHSILQIALVVDENGRLLGTVTDGDIRGAILNGVAMDESIEPVMNKTPFCVKPDYDLQELKATMTARRFHQVPVVDEECRVVGLVLINDLIKTVVKRDNWVVLMAGGLGKRLRPLTETTPKPMVEVGGKPLLETILEKLIAQGFTRFYVSVNYKGEQIKAYFGNGEKWGVEIRYLDEKQALGTAGSLSLIEEIPDKPIMVMNADLLTDINFDKILNFHHDQGAYSTMGVREYDFQVQFGVVEIEGGTISSINEKPIHHFLVNGGIYALQPEAIESIPKNTPIDMPTLFKSWIAEGKTCSAFPIHEYWIDVGRMQDLEKADGAIRNMASHES